MQQTKIQLLPAEMELVSSPDFILTKNAILQKIKFFLEEVQVKQQSLMQHYISLFPEEVLKVSPKISRGENYKGLPWLLLDNPRYFQPGNFFAVRTMFWWGNYFSMTLHVSGKYKISLLEKMLCNYDLLSANHFYLYTADDEWEHDINAGNYKKLSEINISYAEETLSAKSFLKLGVKFPIENFSAVEEKLSGSFALLVSFIC